MYWQEYLVGPLPANNSTDIVPLTYPFNNQKLGVTNVHPIYSTTDGVSFQVKMSSEIEDITKRLWNSVMHLSPGTICANMA
jgi:primary-amine oxidase